MKSLTFTFGAERHKLVFLDATAEHLLELEELQHLMGGTLSSGQPEDAGLLPAVRCIERPAELQLADDETLLLRTRCYRMIYKASDESFVFQIRKTSKQGEQVYLWRSVVIAGTMWMMMHGYSLALMHGVLIEKNNSAVLLCGQSGMGKSTTYRRWRDSGEQCRADDMILLDYSEDSLKAHPLPTWSACSVAEDLSAMHYPAEEPISLKQVICLDRDESRDVLKETTSTHFMLCVYASCTLFQQFFVKNMPKKEQITLIAKYQKVADMLCKKFQPLCFYACLNGDLVPLKELF